MALNSQDSSGKSDWDLIQSAGTDRNERAFAILFDRHRNTVFHTIYQMVKNTELAEDLMMETFAKAFRSIALFQPTHSFSSWLTAVAKNHTLDFLRKKRPNSISIEERMEEGQGRGILQVEEPNPDPEKELEEMELEKNLHLLVDLLKPRYKRLIELRFFEELTYEEIAQQLQLPIGTVKAQLFRAKDLLNQMVKDRSEPL
ncbi:MAG TPA: sigma-70 family RNA polymerase sigma factor [Luteibaculaceae bacterium]|nr:sigma-70 family RNA polymerase sigma factor [Luteibaculaceae bacterium]